MTDPEQRGEIERAIDRFLGQDLMSRRTFMRRTGRGGPPSRLQPRRTPPSSIHLTSAWSCSWARRIWLATAPTRP